MRVFVPFVFAVTSLPLFAQAPQSTPAKSKPAAAKTPSAKSPAAAPSSAPAKSTPAKPAAGTPGQTSVTSTASGPAAATREASKAVITVGNESISAKEFESFIETLPPQYRAQAQGPMKKQIAEQFVRVKLLAAEARRQGLDKDPATQAKIAFNAENILAGIAFNEILKKARVDEAQLKRYYDEHKGSYEEAQARHILIRFKGSQVPLRSGQKELSEEEALAKATDLRKQILAGADFAELAKKESDDAGSGANGGDLGSFARGSMVPAFDAAAFSQPVGQVSEPLKTQFGYHIIKVEKRDSKTFADVKADIEEKMKPDTARDAVEALARSASISYDPAYFGASEPKTPAMTPLSPAPSKTPAAAPQSQPSKPTEPVKP